MTILSSTILFVSFASIAIAVCDAHLSDFVKEFRILKCENQSDGFLFANLASDNNKNYDGKTVEVYDGLYFIRDNDDKLYWTQFGYDDLIKKSEFKNSVRLVQRNDDELNFEADYYRYRIEINELKIYRSIYGPEWNLQKTCFTRTNATEKTFQFVLLSDNNSKKYNGETYIECSRNPSVQRLKLRDGWRDEIFEIEFTTNELQSTETFCKEISKVVEKFPVYHSTSFHPLIYGQNVEANVLELLIGKNHQKGGDATDLCSKRAA